MNKYLNAVEFEKSYRSRPFEIRLLNEMTGRINILCRQDAQDIRGKWQLETDGERHSFGQFLIREMHAGESREFLLSVEVPDISYSSRVFLIVRLFDADGEVIAGESFPLIPPAYLAPAPVTEQFFTGVRFDVSQAIISSGKLSAVIDANGMREMRYNGNILLSGGPRLSLYRCGMIPENLRTLKLDRLRIAADRFVSDGSSVECHALALPSLMEMDELEFTQRFTPREDGTIRYDMEFVVPGSFEGIPRLGVVMRLPGAMNDVTFFGNGPHENYPGDKGCIASKHTLSAEDFYPEYPQLRSGGTRSSVYRAAISAADGRKLQVIAGNNFSFALLPFSESAIDDAIDAGRSTPAAESENFLYIDCRIGENQPVSTGLYRMTLFFSA